MKLKKEVISKKNLNSWKSYSKDEIQVQQLKIVSIAWYISKYEIRNIINSYPDYDHSYSRLKARIFSDSNKFSCSNQSTGSNYDFSRKYEESKVKPFFLKIWWLI